MGCLYRGPARLQYLLLGIWFGEEGFERLHGDSEMDEGPGKLPQGPWKSTNGPLMSSDVGK
jgi:hypothetical protein